MIKNTKKFLIKMTVIEIIFISSLYGSYKYATFVQRKKIINEYSEKEKIKVRNLKNMLMNYFEMTWSNIKILSSSEELKNFIIDESNIEKRKTLEKSLKNWLLFNEFYENISIIKANGNELMRINYNKGFPLPLLTENLKNTIDENYFKEAMMIDDKIIYMTDIINKSVSNGVETKFITPIMNKSYKYGLIKLSILNREIIKELITQLEIEEEIKIFILDSTGNKVYSNFSGESFEKQSDYFNDVSDIKNTENGQIKTKNGMFFFESLSVNERNLKEKTGITIKTSQNEECYWQLFLMLPQNSFEKYFNSKFFMIRLIYHSSQALGAILLFFLYLILFKKREVEEELKLSGEVFENAKEGILISDDHQNIIYVNSSFVRMMGYAKEEILNKKINSIKSNRHPKEFYEKMWGVINNYGKWQGEVWGKRKDGDYFPVWLTISKLVIDKKNTRYFAIYDDLSVLKRNEENIRKLMDFDSTTHLPNKFLFMDRLQQLMSQARIMKENFTVFSLSVSNLKKINANYGIETGDRFLKEFTLALKEKLSAADTLAKFEGSNLYILFPEVQSPAKALEKAEDLLSISKKSFKINKHEILTYMNIGVILYPNNGETVPDLMKNLGLALNISKQDGANNFKFYSNEIHNLAVERSEMDVSLRRAIENKEFYLNYQPQIDVATGELIGAEALIRWEHPILGLITPVKFIPIAEENKFINTIGEWVLREACMQNKVWRFKGYSNLVIAVNISPVQFAQNDFLDILKRVLLETGLEPEHLEIELTEGMMVSDMNIVMTKLHEIKKLGVKISIDDFGTGYSSLSYIKKFPIDKIKIDRVFIKDYPEHDDGRIAKTIVQLGHNLNYKVIAEGAETEEHYEYLKSIKCDEIQGYYFSKPLSASELENKYFKIDESVAATQSQED